MKNKGFTLVELIATLIILSIIALIVTPNILVSISDYKNQVNDNNIQAIKGAAISWAADNVSDTHFPSDENISLLVTIEELIKEGHIDENIKDLVNGGNFDDEDHETYVIINCDNIIDEITGEIKNSKYLYDVYISDNDFIEKTAIEYAKDNNITSTTTIKVSELKEKYIKENIYNTDWYINTYLEQKKLISDNIEVTITYNGKEYKAVVK